MSHVIRKPVFGVLEILDLASICVLLSKQRTTKALVRLRGCAGWSAPLLYAYAFNSFSHDVAHIRDVNLAAVGSPNSFQHNQLTF